jgi:hypothetical protein
MSWLYRFLLLAVSFVVGIESVERTMVALKPPPMKSTLAALLSRELIPPPPPPPVPPPADPLGAMP